MSEQFPHLALQTIAYLDSGWEYDVYVVDSTLAVRFPRYADVANDLDWAEAILEWVGSEAGPALVVPKITLRGEPSAHFPHRFFGADLIPGVRANDPGAPEAMELASDLGRALTALHSISPEGASEIGLGSQKYPSNSLDELVDLVNHTPAMRDLVPEAYAWLQAGPAVPAEYSGPPRVLHDDLQPDHIIVHPSSGRLTGIIDWGPTVGDPAQDLIFILPWRGWSFVMTLLDAYELPVDHEFLERLDFLGRRCAMGSVGHAVAGLHDLAESLRWVDNAFAGRPPKPRSPGSPG